MSDYFFYDMNKKMADLAKKQQLAETAQAAPAKPAPNKLMEAAADYSAKKAAAGKDIGKPGKNFSKIAAGAAKRYGSAEAGKRVAGAVLNKLRHPTEEGVMDVAKAVGSAIAPGVKNAVNTGMALKAVGALESADSQAQLKPWKATMKEGMCSSCGCKPCKCDSMDESALQAAFGKKKYGDQGMKALQKAGRDNASDSTMNRIRNRYDKYDESMTDEGNAFSGAVVKAKRDGIQPGEKISVGGKQYELKEVDATPQNVDDPVSPMNKPAPKASAARLPVPPPKKTGQPKMYPPQAIDDPVRESGMPMTPKQKKFAALAKPFDKITFADKIVGAKKEVDEMLGDVAASAMKNAVGKMRGRNRDMEESFLDDEPTSRRSSTGGRIDTSEPGVTRHRAVKGNYSGAGHDAGADDEPSGQIGRRKVGAGMGKKIGAKINRGTSKLMTREGDMPEDMIEPQDSGEYDREGEMAKDDIKTVVRHAQALEKILGDDDNLPEWVQAKLAKIEGMMTAVDDYMQNQKSDSSRDDMEMDEERTSKRDDRAEKAGRKVAKDIEYDEKKKDGIHGKRRGSEDNKAERAGKKVTRDIEYDEKKDKKKKEVDETTTSGSVATGGAAPKSSGGHSYGKGIYDSLNRQLENMISESMNINMSMNNDEHGGPRQSLTVTATDDDAVMLAGLLKMAGMGHGDEHIHAMTDNDPQMLAIQTMDHDHGDEPCPDCGMTDCGCDDQMMDEAYGDTDETKNHPDYPTDQVGTDNAMMYSGGLDGPKSTGQTTVPVIAGQHDRMGHHDHELRRMMEIAGLR
jgi:hypothetical protein